MSPSGRIICYYSQITMGNLIREAVISCLQLPSEVSVPNRKIVADVLLTSEVSLLVLILILE